MPSTCSSKTLALILSPCDSLSPMRSHGLPFSVLAHIDNTRTQTPSTHSFLLPSVSYNFYSIRCNKHSGFSAVLSICMCGMCTCVSACTLAHACEDLRSMLSVFVYCSSLCIKTGSLIEPGAHHLARLDGQRVPGHLCLHFPVLGLQLSLGLTFYTGVRM